MLCPTLEKTGRIDRKVTDVHSEDWVAANPKRNKPNHLIFKMKNNASQHMIYLLNDKVILPSSEPHVFSISSPSGRSADYCCSCDTIKLNDWPYIVVIIGKEMKLEVISSLLELLKSNAGQQMIYAIDDKAIFPPPRNHSLLIFMLWFSSRYILLLFCDEIQLEIISSVLELMTASISLINLFRKLLNRNCETQNWVL